MATEWEPDVRFCMYEVASLNHKAGNPQKPPLPSALEGGSPKDGAAKSKFSGPPQHAHRNNKLKIKGPNGGTEALVGTELRITCTQHRERVRPQWHTNLQNTKRSTPAGAGLEPDGGGRPAPRSQHTEGRQSPRDNVTRPVFRANGSETTTYGMDRRITNNRYREHKSIHCYERNTSDN